MLIITTIMTTCVVMFRTKWKCNLVTVPKLEWSAGQMFTRLTGELFTWYRCFLFRITWPTLSISMQFPTSPDIKQLSHNNFPVRFGTHFLLLILQWRLTLLLASQCLISFQFMLEIEVVPYNVSGARPRGKSESQFASILMKSHWWAATAWHRMESHRMASQAKRKEEKTLSHS